MATDTNEGRPITIPARDGYPLKGHVFGEATDRVVVINAATAVPQRFYRHFAGALAEAGFTAPVLAYNIDDDKWGTPRSVNAMMRAYPNVERRHVDPRVAGLESIGHMGFFRPSARVLWGEVIGWFQAH